MYKKQNKYNKENTKKIFDRIVTNLQQIVDDGKYVDFLKFNKKLKSKYSFSNLILIYSQFPEATKVAGKGKWKTVNREVKLGAQKIFIIAPIPRKFKQKVTVIEDGEEIEKERLVQYNAYKYTYVYDISQTTGDEIPLECKDIVGDDKEEFYEKLKQFSPVPVYEKELNGSTKGYYNTKAKEIIVDSNASKNDKVHIILHELTHCLYDDFDYSTDRDLSETFVESVAYIVADHFGLNTSSFSFNYVIKWAHGDTKKVIELGNKIQKSADDLIEKIENFEMQELELAA